jgi:hypothetical protein
VPAATQPARGYGRRKRRFSGTSSNTRSGTGQYAGPDDDTDDDHDRRKTSSENLRNRTPKR